MDDTMIKLDNYTKLCRCKNKKDLKKECYSNNGITKNNMCLNPDNVPILKLENCKWTNK